MNEHSETWWRERHRAWQMAVMDGRTIAGFREWVNEGLEWHVWAHPEHGATEVINEPLPARFAH